ncbi:MFS transporter [Modestobacter muralis]|uniref:MFS transporter n=1 Tax=Modestobacter muralis TaxID=1608614 RepID=A0A6P0H9J8_9ACTN|nr:MFS transporter [Modestobacter muralis]
MPSLLRVHRDFRLLWAGDTVSAVGDAVTFVAFPLVALETLGASTATAALLSGVPSVPMLVLGLPIGAWVDRLPRRPMFVASTMAAGAAVASVPLAAVLGVLSMAQLVLVALVMGTAQVVSQTAAGALLPEVVPRDRLVEANGALQVSGSAAQIGGPSLGGLLVQVLGAAGALVADAISFVLAGLVVLAVRSRSAVRVRESRRRGSLWREIALGLRHVLADPVLRVLMVNAAIANLALSAVFALLVPFLSRTVGLAPGLLGLLLGIGTGGGLVGAALAGRLARRLGTARLVLRSVLLAAPFGLLMPLAAPGWRLASFVAGLFVVCVGLGLYNVTVVSYRQAATPPELLGRVTSAMRVVQQGVMPLGALMAAGLTLALGARGALAVSVAIDLIPGLVLLASPVRRLRELPVPDDDRGLVLEKQVPPAGGASKLPTMHEPTS